MDGWSAKIAQYMVHLVDQIALLSTLAIFAIPSG